MGMWFAKLHETFIETGYYHLILEGFRNTIIISLGACLIGIVIGTVIAVIRYFAEENRVLVPLAHLCEAYVTVIRGIPVVVLLLVFYYIIMKSSEGILVGIMTFGINSGAYMAELIRGGINAVDFGQTEAGRSLGMSRIATMRYIVFPQALKHILPAIGNELIALIKETSVAGYVAVVDLTRAGNLVRNNTYDAVNPLMIVAVIYLLLVIFLTKILGIAERRMSVSGKR